MWPVGAVSMMLSRAVGPWALLTAGLGLTALLTVSYTLQGYVGYIFIFWFYLYLVEVRRFEVMQAAAVTALPWLCTLVAIPALLLILLLAREMVRPGNMDLWVMKSDGTGEKQITFTDDWQEGGAQFLPDSRTILTRAWKRKDQGGRITPMEIFTVDRVTVFRAWMAGGQLWLEFIAYHYMPMRRALLPALVLGLAACGAPSAPTPRM